MDFIEVELLNWDKHQPRKDIKHPTWFALNNRILEDPKLFGLTDTEWKALLYIFCQASQQNSKSVRINLTHAKRVCEIPEKSIRTVLTKLAYAGVTSAIRDTTLHYTTNSTVHDTTDPAPPAPVAVVDLALNSEIWKAYSEAYFMRYGTEPVRNASVNSQIKQIGQRLGKESPDVVRFFVSHNNAFYVRGLHKVGMCLADCESIRTQWATGTTVTNRQAQQADDGATTLSQLQRVREGKL